MMKQAGLNLPVWLNEGVAEVYSTFKPLGSKVMIGAPIASHVYTVQQSPWIPVSRVLEVDHQSVEYNRRAHAGPFYAESWALTHMLMMDEEYKSSWGAILAGVANGKPAAQVIQTATGKPLASVDKDLQAYLRGARRFL